MQLTHFKLHSAKDLADAAKLSAEYPRSRLLAGGTFLINRLRVLKKKGLSSPDPIISLRRVKELFGCSLIKQGLKIGPMTTLNEIAKFSGLPREVHVLRDLCLGIATTPIRNMATIGGNLTSRYTWAECGAVLIALDAKLTFYQAPGSTADIGCEDFFRQGAKSTGILSEVLIPLRKERIASYQRVPRLSDVDIPLLAVCVSARSRNNSLTDVRIVLNTGDHFPQRAIELEKKLNKISLSDLDCQAAAEQLDKTILEQIADNYKKDRLKVETEKALIKLKKEVS